MTTTSRPRRARAAAAAASGSLAAGSALAAAPDAGGGRAAHDELHLHAPRTGSHHFVLPVVLDTNPPAADDRGPGRRRSSPTTQRDAPGRPGQVDSTTRARAASTAPSTTRVAFGAAPADAIRQTDPAAPRLGDQTVATAVGFVAHLGLLRLHRAGHPGTVEVTAGDLVGHAGRSTTERRRASGTSDAHLHGRPTASRRSSTRSPSWRPRPPRSPSRGRPSGLRPGRHGHRQGHHQQRHARRRGRLLRRRRPSPAVRVDKDGVAALVLPDAASARTPSSRPSCRATRDVRRQRSGAASCSRSARRAPRCVCR